MLRYETLILAVTHITADELSGIENLFEKKASDFKGNMISFEKWGKYRLSYPVKKNDYGIYILARYEIPKESSKKIFKILNDFLKINCNEIVMRYVTIKLDPKDTLTYKRPEPVDGGRSGGLDTFLKENKMESFLNTNVNSSKEKIEKEPSLEKNKDETEEKKETTLQQTEKIK